jgi:hypothetical protein
MVMAAKVGMWIKTDGSLTPVIPAKGTKFSLKEVQDMVGGYVERVQGFPKGKVTLVNEEGLMRKLPYNPVASNMAGFDIVGDAVILPRGMGW